MGKSVNKVILLGNVGKDPEIRATPTGTVASNFSLATTDRIKDQTGNWSDRTEWHSLVAFKRTAEIIRDYVHKGSKLYIEGKLQTRSWDDKTTQEKKYRTEIVVLEISLLDGRSEQNGNGKSHDREDRSYAHAGAAKEEEYGDLGITDDDVPF